MICVCVCVKNVCVRYAYVYDLLSVACAFTPSSQQVARAISSLRRLYVYKVLPPSCSGAVIYNIATTSS